MKASISHRLIMVCDQNFGPPGGSDGKESVYNEGDLGSIPELGRTPGEGNGNPLQYPCLENPMDRGAWWATARGSQRVRHGSVQQQHSVYNMVTTVDTSVLCK